MNLFNWIRRKKPAKKISEAKGSVPKSVYKAPPKQNKGEKQHYDDDGVVGYRHVQSPHSQESEFSEPCMLFGSLVCDGVQRPRHEPDYATRQLQHHVHSDNSSSEPSSSDSSFSPCD